MHSFKDEWITKSKILSCRSVSNFPSPVIFFQMIRIWPRKPHDAQSGAKRKTQADVDAAANASSRLVDITASGLRGHRVTKGGSLDSSASTTSNLEHKKRLFANAVKETRNSSQTAGSIGYAH